jgi:hypothetical protein
LRAQEVITMLSVKKGLCLGAFLLVACSGKDVNLGGGGPSGGSTSEVALDGGGAGEDAAYGGSATGSGSGGGSGASGSSSSGAGSTTSGGGGGSSSSSGGGTTTPEDAGSVTGEVDAGTTAGLCGSAPCAAGQECCIVALDVATCTVGLQCVYGGCPPAPCDPQDE